MVRSATSSAQGDADPARQFNVYCLHKQKSTTNATSALSTSPNATLTNAPSTSSSPPLTYDDVVRELDSERWSFAPYPRCDRGQLLQVHAYWVAVPRPRDGTDGSRNEHAEELRNLCNTGSATTDSCADDSCCKGDDVAPEETARSSPKTTLAADTLEANKRPPLQPRFCCVVGVVWVRLSPASTRAPTQKSQSSSSAAQRGQSPVEGYLQVVLTHPAFRRRGLASWLLRTCLALKEAPSNVFAADRESAQPHSVQRWHLHTLMNPPMSSKAVNWGTVKKCRVESDDEVKDTLNQVSDDAVVVKATLAMYRQLGFTERRYIRQYYGGTLDAVELMRQS